MNDISEELRMVEDARCRAALLPEERVLLIARPRTQLGVLETLFRVIPGVVLACSLSYALCMMSAMWWLALLITLPFWGVAIALPECRMGYERVASRRRGVEKPIHYLAKSECVALIGYSAFCILTLGWSWQGVYGRLRKRLFGSDE